MSHLSTWQVETEMKMVTPKVQNQQKVGVLETLMVATQIYISYFQPDLWGNDPI